MLGRIAVLSGLLRPVRNGLAVLRVNQRVSRQEYNAHFEQRLPAIDNECGQIIREMGREQPSVKRLNGLLESYLEFTKFENFYPRTLKGVLSILSAIGMSGCEPLLKYKYQLLDQTNRLRLEGESLEELELSYFIVAEMDYRKTAKQKLKAMRLLFNLLATLEHNFAVVNPIHYFSIAQTLTSDQNQQHRMVKVARLLQAHAVALMRRVAAKDAALPAGVEKIFDERFLCLLSETYKAYGAESVEDFQVFFKFIEQKFLNRFFTGLVESRYGYCNSLFRSFNYEIKTVEGVYYKQKLFDCMVQAYLNTPRNVSNFARSKHGYYLCSSILTHQFYQYSQTLRFQQAGSLRYLPRSELAAKPKLPDVFWTIYRQNPQAVNCISYLVSTIRDVYPQNYIATKGEQMATIEPYLETEMRIRAEAALVGLGLQFQSEINISGRFVDFLIGERVLLELDGIHHFAMSSMEMTDKTQTRNVHLLLKGYRIVLVNIYEYNLAREFEQLRELISSKLALLEEKDAAMVM